MFSYTFDTHLTPTKAQEQDNVYQSNQNANQAVQVFAAAAQLDWFGQEREQAVLAFSDYYLYEDSNASIVAKTVWEVWVVTFDDNGLMTFHQSSLKSDDVFQIWGMAVGRFTCISQYLI